MKCYLLFAKLGFLLLSLLSCGTTEEALKAPPKTEVFVNIVSNNSINSGRNEKIKIHRKADYQDSRRTRTRHPKPYRLPTLVI
jgi:hypothetical protein